ncbi:hypothetical protein Q4493_13360 [Colwellia sp. 1_MG-2023]|uniref:hypothetical protein n=1 Tax=Colwellia sp. 1_MG-2023 TaxID=3062649 RepID=UPI0026E124DF|nr:hypothetical protein [Colwellia sp. 1_MG-2023]MDO6446766.1 hypothetical protein [Colwellia sp. 1_MG-2023]
MSFIDKTIKVNEIKLSSLILIFISIVPMFYSFSALSQAKITVNNSHNAEGFARTQIKNETTKELACWVAIDGFKSKFRLPPAATSRWFTANDKRYSYTNFSTWCDNIEYYPQYKNYSIGGQSSD